MFRTKNSSKGRENKNPNPDDKGVNKSINADDILDGTGDVNELLLREEQNGANNHISSAREVLVAVEPTRVNDTSAKLAVAEVAKANSISMIDESVGDVDAVLQEEANPNDSVGSASAILAAAANAAAADANDGTGSARQVLVAVEPTRTDDTSAKLAVAEDESVGDVDAVLQEEANPNDSVGSASAILAAAAAHDTGDVDAFLQEHEKANADDPTGSASAFLAAAAAKGDGVSSSSQSLNTAAITEQDDNNNYLRVLSDSMVGFSNSGGAAASHPSSQALQTPQTPRNDGRNSTLIFSPGALTEFDEGLHRQLAELKQENNTLTQALADQEQKLEQARLELAAVSGLSENYQAENLKLSVIISQLEKRAEQLTDKAEQAVSHIRQEIQEEKAKLEAQFNTQRQALLKELASKISSLTSEKEIAVCSADKANQEIARLNEQLAKASTELAAQKAEAEKIQQASQSQVVQLVAELAAKCSALAEQQAALEAVQGEKANLVAKLELVQQASATQQELSNAQAVKLAELTAKLEKSEANLHQLEVTVAASAEAVKAKEDENAKIIENGTGQFKLLHKKYFGDNISYRVNDVLGIGDAGGDVGKYLSLCSDTIWKKIKNFFSRESAKNEQLLSKVKDYFITCAQQDNIDRFKSTCLNTRDFLNSEIKKIKPSGENAVLLTLLKSMQDSVQLIIGSYAKSQPVIAEQKHAAEEKNRENQKQFSLKDILDAKGKEYLTQREQSKAIKFRDDWVTHFGLGGKSQGAQRKEYLRELSDLLNKYAADSKPENQKEVYDKIFDGFKNYESRGNSNFNKSLHSHLMFAYRCVNTPEMLAELSKEREAELKPQRFLPSHSAA